MMIAKAVTSAKTSSRQMSTAVYLWSRMPRLGTKTGNLKLSIEMPKGNPSRIKAFDDLNVKTLRVGLRHSAVIT
jgi:hypothetical protein